MNARIAFSAASLLLVALAGPALAASPVIDFASAAGGGTISYAGGPTDVLIGSDIVIDTVFGQNTPANSTVHGVTQGLLNFTSGPFVSFSNNVYTFGPGGAASFTITGAVPDAGIANTTLLTGQLEKVTVDVSQNTVFLFTGSGADTKDPALVAYFGLTGASFAFGPAVVHINPNSATCAAPCAFSGDAFGIDIPNVGSVSATGVPTLDEWAVLGMLTLLASVGVWAIRRRQALADIPPAA
jgi:hypothetical protein